MRTICVITGTRAEYGLLYWLIKEIPEDPDLELQSISTGMHLPPEFGLTYRQIEKDGFKPCVRIGINGNMKQRPPLLDNPKIISEYLT